MAACRSLPEQTRLESLQKRHRNCQAGFRYTLARVWWHNDRIEPGSWRVRERIWLRQRLKANKPNIITKNDKKFLARGSILTAILVRCCCYGLIVTEMSELERFCPLPGLGLEPRILKT